MTLCLFALALGALSITNSSAQVRVATFDIDVTPPVGSELAYDPVKRHDEISLRCRGLAILGSGEPIVLCAIDWIGVANASHDVFRESLAEAAGTSRERVAVHALHQHDAPRSDFSSESIIQELGIRNYNLFDSFYQRQVIHRTALALKEAIAEARTVTHYGWGTAEVEDVVSNRRILGPDGKVRVMRFTTARDPLVRAEPVGVVDPEISLISFWNDDEPVAVLSYFATHPQSYYRTGIPSPDFPGIARFLRGQGQPKALHVHFNGAGGNIGAGKYNDGNTENRILLAQRLADGMLTAWEGTEKFPLTSSSVGWQSETGRSSLGQASGREGSDGQNRHQVLRWLRSHHSARLSSAGEIWTQNRHHLSEYRRRSSHPHARRAFRGVPTSCQSHAARPTSSHGCLR